MSCRCDGECLCRLPTSDPNTFANAVARMCGLAPEDVCVESECERHGGTRPCRCQAFEPKEGEVW